MTETNNSNAEENGVRDMKVPKGESADSHCTNPALQSKSVSSTQQYTKKALRQALRQHHKRRNGMSMMVNKAVPRVVLTPLKVSDDQPDSPAGSEAQNGIEDREDSEKGMKQNNRSHTGKQISQHLKKLKKSGLGYLKWTKAEDIDIETPGSILVNTNLRALINKHTFASLPQHFQQYLLLLLPDVDRQMGSDGVARPCNSALNNEFFAYAAQGWKQRLAEGEFTPEMQLRIRQEMEKERKTEIWKEKYYETYYGQKSGVTEKDSQSCMPDCDEDQENINTEVPAFIHTAVSAEKIELKLSDSTCVCEDKDISSVFNRDVASKPLSVLPTEDIVLSGFPEVSEEAVIQEEIAEEVEPNSCTYIDYPDPQIHDPSEHVSTDSVKESPTITLPLKDKTALQQQPSLETPAQPSTEVIKAVSDETETSATSLLLLPSASETETDEMSPQTEEDAAFDKVACIRTGHSTLVETNCLSLSNETKVEKDLHDTGEPDLKHACDNEDTTMSEILESEAQVTSQAVDNALSCEPNVLPLTSFKTHLEENAELDATIGADILTPHKPKDSTSYDNKVVPPQLTSDNSEDTDIECLNPDTEVVSVPNPGNEGHGEETPTFQQPDEEFDETESENTPDESLSPFSTPNATCASPLANDAVHLDIHCNGKVDCSDSVSEHPSDELDSEASQNLDDICKPVPQATDPKPEQSLPDTVLTKPVIETRLQEELHAENTQLKENTKRTESTTIAYTMDESLPEINVSKPISYDQVADKTVKISPSLDMLKVKLHKSYPGRQPPSTQEMCHRKPGEVIRPLLLDCTDSTDTENPKRKPGELTSGTCKEKRARIECSESGLTSSPAGGREEAPKEEVLKEEAPKEEPRVPPLKIQLSKVGLPFIIKTQSVSKPEAKLSSPGRNLGARTLADIKARAHQARAQREAAAAAAIAAAAHITAGEGGPPADGCKTRTLAHIKEQTKVKLFPKHHARPQVHHHAKSTKQHNEDHHSSELPFNMTRDCAAGVIIANPNRRSPSDCLTLVQLPSTNLKPSENKTAIPPSVVSISVPNSVRCFPVHQTLNSVSQVRMTNTEDPRAKESAVCNSQVPVSTRLCSIPPSSSVLVSVCSSSLQSSVLKVSPSGAKTSILSSSQRAVLPKYNHELPSVIPESSVCPSTNTQPCSSLGNENQSHMGQIRTSSTCAAVARPTSNGFHCYVPESSMSHAHEKPKINYQDHHAYQENGDKLQRFQVMAHKDKSVNQKEIMTTEVIKACATQKDIFKCKELPPEDSVTNKAIPCKVIVDHSSATYQNSPTMPVTQHNPPIKGVKTETVLRLQESIMSRAESFRQRTEQNGTFSAASRGNSKTVHGTYGVLQNIPLSQQVSHRESDPEGGAANLIYSSLLYKHAEKTLAIDRDIESKIWPKETKNMNTVVIQKTHQECNLKLDIRESKDETTPRVFPNRGISKAEVHNSDTGDFKEPLNPRQHLVPRHLDDRQPRSITSNKCSLAAENYRVVSAGSGSSCRQSSVEASNPLVTQLLQGNLPLEKVLPQPRLGGRLEIHRLPSPFHTNSLRKPMVSERTAMEQAQSCLSHKGAVHSLAMVGQSLLQQRDVIASNKVTTALAEMDLFKPDPGNSTMDGDNRNSSCSFGAHLNALDMGQKIVQEWGGRNVRQRCITPSLEIIESKRPLFTCSLQKRVSGLNKNSSFSSESDTSQRPFYPPPTADRDSSLLSAPVQACKTSPFVCAIPNKLVLNRNQGQNGPESMTTDQFKKGAYPTNLRNMQADYFETVSRNKPLAHSTNALPKIQSDQRQAAGVMETNRNLNWLTSGSVCSRIKVEPISFDDNLSNSCEINSKQASYEQNDWTKTSTVPPFVAPEQQKVFTQQSPHLDPHQQVYSNYSSIHFSNGKLNRTASVIEKSVGNPRLQATPVSSHKFANRNSVDELQLKCSCRLKAMIVCKGCGAFCHDDCIGPSELCVACLVVR
ncbi:putative Polycomb group protein ASXL3 isoform X2 [Brienomyrus brachyistius]|nr:putative Polycomb group protein ASXL3 isoform X2 [Brienomyrus brachyistius]